MRTKFRWMKIALVSVCLFSFVSIPAQAKEAVYQTGFQEWLATQNGFSGWEMTGTVLNSSGELVISPGAALTETDPYPVGGYYGGNFYTGGSYYVGEAIGPETAVNFDFKELIASWNAVTPTGSWIEMLVRAKVSGSWTKWYNLGIWASGSETVQRHSVMLQGDTNGYVSVDTLVLSDKKAVSEAYQLKIRLFSLDQITTPTVRYLSAAYSTSAPKKAAVSAGNPAYWGTLINVPECSQMVYPDGGNVWCSPTSTSMIVSYLTGYTGPCETAVRAAVDGVYDWIYDGHGNWPFNTAYAATYGLQGSVRRFTSMEEVETWVAQGVPVAFSFAWNKSELTGAAVSSSSGHLAVFVGFDSQGNPIVNDPAAASDEEVQRTYLRSELEPLWLQASGGTVYLIKP